MIQYKKNFIDVFPGIFRYLKEDGKRHSAVEVAVYLYIAHHYCLTKKPSIVLSFKEIENGTMMDEGTGFSGNTIGQAVNRLVKMGLLKVKRRMFTDSNGVHRRSSHVYHPMLPNDLGTSVVEFELAAPAISIGVIPIEDEVTSPKKSIGVTPQDEVTPIEKVSGVTPIYHDYSNHSISIHKNKNNLIQSNQIKSFNQSSTIPSKYPLLNKNNPIQSSDPYQEITAKLWNILGANNKKHPGSTTKGWKATFKKFIDLPEVGFRRFRPVLDWYCEHLKDEYVPIAYSAKTFCDKFTRIESAMLRYNEDEQEKELATDPDAPPPGYIPPTPEEQQEFDEDAKRILWDHYRQ